MKIAVLIPTHNNGAVIQFAIESALKRTVEPSEVIVVADGARRRCSRCLMTIRGGIAASAR